MSEGLLVTHMALLREKNLKATRQQRGAGRKRSREDDDDDGDNVAVVQAPLVDAQAPAPLARVDKEARKRLCQLEDRVAALTAPPRAIPPTLMLAVKKTGRRLLFEAASAQQTPPIQDSINVLRSTMGAVQTQDNAPVIDDDAHNLCLERCVSYEDAMELALNLFMVDQEYWIASHDQVRDERAQEQMALMEEKARTQQANQQLMQALREKKQLEAKINGLKEQIQGLHRAVGQQSNLRLDAEHQVADLRKNMRHLSRTHAEAVCDRISKSLERERKYISAETKRWAGIFNVKGSALQGLEDMQRNVAMRLRNVADASMDLAALAPSGDNESPPRAGRDMLRASAMPVMQRRPSSSSSPSYIPNAMVHDPSGALRGRGFNQHGGAQLTPAQMAAARGKSAAPQAPAQTAPSAPVPMAPQVPAPAPQARGQQPPLGGWGSA